MGINRLELNFNSLPKNTKIESKEQTADPRKQACDFLAKQLQPKLLSSLGIQINYENLLLILLGTSTGDKWIVGDFDRDGNPDISLDDLYESLKTKLGTDPNNPLNKISKEEFSRKLSVSSPISGTAEQFGLQIETFADNGSIDAKISAWLEKGGDLSAVFTDLQNEQNPSALTVNFIKLIQSIQQRDGSVDIGVIDNLRELKILTKDLLEGKSIDFDQIISNDISKEALEEYFGPDEKLDFNDLITFTTSLADITHLYGFKSGEMKYFSDMMKLCLKATKFLKVNRGDNPADLTQAVSENKGEKGLKIEQAQVEVATNEFVTKLTEKVDFTDTDKFTNSIISNAPIEDGKLVLKYQSKEKKEVTIEISKSDFDKFLKFWYKIINPALTGDDSSRKESFNVDFKDWLEIQLRIYSMGIEDAVNVVIGAQARSPHVQKKVQQVVPKQYEKELVEKGQQEQPTVEPLPVDEKRAVTQELNPAPPSETSKSTDSVASSQEPAQNNQAPLEEANKVRLEPKEASGDPVVKKGEPAPVVKQQEPPLVEKKSDVVQEPNPASHQEEIKSTDPDATSQEKVQDNQAPLVQAKEVSSEPKIGGEIPVENKGDARSITVQPPVKETRKDDEGKGSSKVPLFTSLFSEEIKAAEGQIVKAIETAKIKKDQKYNEVVMKANSQDNEMLTLLKKLQSTIGDKKIFDIFKTNLLEGLKQVPKYNDPELLQAIEKLTYEEVRSDKKVAGSPNKYFVELNNMQTFLNNQDEINKILYNLCASFLLLKELGYKEPDILKMSVNDMNNLVINRLSADLMPNVDFPKFCEDMDFAIKLITLSDNKKNIIIKADGTEKFNRFVSYFKKIIDKYPDVIKMLPVEKALAEGKEEYSYKVEGFGIIKLAYKPEGADIKTNDPESTKLDTKHKALRQELLEKFYNRDSGSFPVSYKKNPANDQEEKQGLTILKDSVHSDYLLDDKRVDVPLTYAIASMNQLIYKDNIEEALHKCVSILSKYWLKEKIDNYFNISEGTISFKDGKEIEADFMKEQNELPADSGIQSAFETFIELRNKSNDWQFYKGNDSQELNRDFRQEIEKAEKKGGAGGTIPPTNQPVTKVETVYNGMKNAFGLSLAFIEKPTLGTVPPIDDWHMINIKVAYLKEKHPERYQHLMAIKEHIGLGREMKVDMKKEFDDLISMDKDFYIWLAETYLPKGVGQVIDEYVITNIQKALFRSENILLPDKRSLSLSQIMEEYRQILNDRTALDDMFSWNDIGVEAEQIMIGRGFVRNEKLVKFPSSGEIDSINTILLNQRILQELNKKGYKKLEDAPEDIVKEIRISLKDNFKGVTIEAITKRQIFQGATNLLLQGININSSGSVDKTEKYFGLDTVKNTFNTLFIGEVVTEHFGATIKSQLLTSKTDEAAVQKLKLSFLGSDIDDLDASHIKIIAEMVIDSGSRLGKDSKEYKWALDKAAALNSLANSLTKPMTCTNKTLEDTRVQTVVDAIYFLRRMLEKNRYIEMGGSAYNNKVKQKISINTPTIDKFLSTDLSKLINKTFNQPEELGSIQALSAIGSLAYQPMKTTYEFGIEMGVNLNALGLQVIQNFRNFVSGSTLSMVTDANGNIVIDQETGKVSFRKVGDTECLDIAAQMTSTILQLRLIAPVKFYDFFGITDDVNEGSYYSAYIKFATANFLMLSSAKGFWNSMMGRAFKTVGVKDIVSFTEFAARQFGIRCETKAGRLGIFAPMLDILQAKYDEVKPGEEKTNLQNKISKMKDMIKTGMKVGSYAINPLGHEMQRLNKMADPKGADEKKISKTAAKVALGVLNSWQEFNQKYSLYAQEGKLISKWITDCKRIISGENGEFKLNVEEHDLNKWINGNNVLKELEKQIRIPSSIKIRLGNEKLVDAKVIKVSIGSIGSNSEVSQAKHPVDIRVHYAGQGAPVSSETVSVELVINESFVRNALRNIKIGGLTEKQNLKVAYAQLSQQINMHIQWLSQRTTNMVLPVPHGNGGQEAILNPLEVEKGLSNIGVTVEKDFSQRMALNIDGFNRLKDYIRQNKINLLTEELYYAFLKDGFYEERSAVVSDRIIFEEIIHPLFNAKDMDIKESTKIIDKDGKLNSKELRIILRERILIAIKSGKITLPGLDANNPDNSIVETLLSEVETKFNRYYESFSFAKAVDKEMKSEKVNALFKDKTTEIAELNLLFKLYDAEINKQLFEVDKIPQSIRDNEVLFDKYFKKIKGSSDFVKINGDITKIMESIKEDASLNKADANHLLKDLEKASKSTDKKRRESFEQEIQKRGTYLKEIYEQLQQDYKSAVDSNNKSDIEKVNIRRVAILSKLYQASDGKIPNFSQTMFLKYNHLPGNDYWFNLGTGEGKSVVSYLLTLDQLIRGKADGDKIILTSSDPALVEKAYLEARPLFKMLGISVNTFSSDLNTHSIKELKSNMDNTEVLFCLNTDLHFANAHDRKQVDPEYKIMASFGNRIVIHDEGDLARFESEHNPVVISNASSSLDKYSSQWKDAVSIIENASKEKGLISCDYSKKTIILNKELVPYIKMHAPSIYKLITSSDSAEKAAGWKILSASARVNYFHTNKVHYVVEGKKVKFIFDVREVVLIDELTGFRKPGHALQDGLMQAIQAKEGLPVHEEMYSDTVYLPEDTMKKAKRGFSISGTFDVSKSLLKKAMHGLFIQPTVPVTRVDMPDVLAKDKLTQSQIIRDNLKSPDVADFAHLICVKSEKEAIDLKDYLKKYFDVEIEILIDSENMLKNERTRILNNAGKPGHITIATIAGRGTDIKTQNKMLSELGNISAQGGLTVTITDYYQDTRIIEQIRGRCNRLLNPLAGGAPTERGSGKTWLVASLDGFYFEERPIEKNMLKKLFFDNNSKAVVVKEGNTREQYQNSEKRVANKKQVDVYFNYIEEVSGKPLTEKQKAEYIGVMKTVYAENENLYRMGQDSQGESLYERNQAIFRFEGQIGDRLSSIKTSSEFIDFYIDMMHKSVDAVLVNHNIVLTDTINETNIKYFRAYFGRAKKLGLDVNRLGIKNLDDFIGKPVYELVNILKEEKWVRTRLEDSFKKKSSVRSDIDNIRNNLEVIYNQVRAEAHKMNHIYGNQVQYQTHENGRADLEKELQEKLEKHIFNKFSLRFMDEYRVFLSGEKINPSSFSNKRQLTIDVDISKKELLEEFAKTRDYVEIEHIKELNSVRLCFKKLANDPDIAALESILSSSELELLEKVPKSDYEKQTLKEFVEKSLEATLKDIGSPLKQFEPRKIRFMGTYFSLGNQNDIAAINELLNTLGSKKILVSEWQGDHDVFFYGEQKGAPEMIKIKNADGKEKTVQVVTVSKEIINNPNRVLGFTFMQESNLLGLGRSDNLIILRPDEIRKQYRDMALVAFSRKYVNESAKNSAFEFFKLHGIGSLEEAGIDPRDVRNDIYNKTRLSVEDQDLKGKIEPIITQMVGTVLEHEKAHQKDDPRPKNYSHYRFVNGGQYVQNRGLIDVLSEFRADYGGRLTAILAMKDNEAKKSELARMGYEASYYTNETYKNTLQREVAEEFLQLYDKAIVEKDYSGLGKFAEKIEIGFKNRIELLCKKLDFYYKKEIGKRKNDSTYDKKVVMVNDTDFDSKKSIIDEENKKEGKSADEYIVKAHAKDIFSEFNKDAIIEINEQAKKFNTEIQERNGLKQVKDNIINMILSNPDNGMRVLEDIDISLSERTEIIQESFEKAFSENNNNPSEIEKEIYVRAGSNKTSIIEFLTKSEKFGNKSLLNKYLIALAVTPAVENNNAFKPEMTPLEKVQDCKKIIYNEFTQHNVNMKEILFEYLRGNADTKEIIEDIESSKTVQEMFNNKYSWQLVLECLTISKLSPEQAVRITLEASSVPLTASKIHEKTGLDEKIVEEVLKDNHSFIKATDGYQLERNARISKSMGLNTTETKIDKIQKSFTLVYDGAKWTTKESLSLAKTGVKGGLSGAAAESVSMLLQNILSDKKFVGLLKPGNEYSWSLNDLKHPALEGFLSWSVFEMKNKFMPITHGVIVIDSMKNLSKVSEKEVGSATAREMAYLSAFMGISSGATYALLKYNPFFRSGISHQIPLFMAVSGSAQITPIVEKHILSGMKETLDNSDWMKGLAGSMRFLDAVLPHNWMVDKMLPVTIAQVGDAKLTNKALEKVNPKDEAEYIVNWVMNEEFKASKYSETTGLFAVREGVLSIDQADILSIEGFEEELLSNIYAQLATEYIQVYNNRFNNMTGRVKKVPKDINEIIKMIDDSATAKSLSADSKAKLAEKIYSLFDYKTLSNSKKREINMELLFIEDQEKHKGKYSFTKEEMSLYRTRMVKKIEDLKNKQIELAQKYRSSADTEKEKLEKDIVMNQSLIAYYGDYTKEENDDGIILGMMKWDAFIKSKSEYNLTPSVLEQAKGLGVNLLGGYMDGMALKYSIKFYKGFKRIKAIELALSQMHEILFGAQKTVKATEVLSEVDKILTDSRKCKTLLKYLNLQTEVSTFSKIKRFGFKAKDMEKVIDELTKALQGKDLKKALTEGASVAKKALSLSQRVRQTTETLLESNSKSAKLMGEGFMYGIKYMEKFKTLIDTSPKAMKAITSINVYGSKLAPKASTLLKWAKPLVVLDQVSSIGTKYHENWDDLLSQDKAKRNAAQFKISVTSAGGFLVEGLFDIVGLGDTYDYSLNYWSKSSLFQWTFNQLNKPAEAISRACEYFSADRNANHTASDSLDISDLGV